MTLLNKKFAEHIAGKLQKKKAVTFEVGDKVETLPGNLPYPAEGIVTKMVPGAIWVDFGSTIGELRDVHPGEIKKVLTKVESSKKKAYVKEMNVGETTSIPTGNAQAVYGIKGEVGEEFDVDREGTMVPIGRYKVVSGPEVSKETSGPWGIFSDIVVEKIAGKLQEKEIEIKSDTREAIGTVDGVRYEIWHRIPQGYYVRTFGSIKIGKDYFATKAEAEEHAELVLTQ